MTLQQDTNPTCLTRQLVSHQLSGILVSLRSEETKNKEDAAEYPSHDAQFWIRISYWEASHKIWKVRENRVLFLFAIFSYIASRCLSGFEIWSTFWAGSWEYSEIHILIVHLPKDFQWV